MTQNIRAERKIAVDASELWKTISQITGMEDWYPDLIRESKVLDGDGPHPVRNCIMQNGGHLNERILLRDSSTRTFVYAIDSHPLPAKNVVGVIRIDDLGQGQSHVSWSADMVLDPVSAAEVTDLVTGMYKNGLKALEAFHRD